MTDRYPHDLDAESALLGAMLLNSEANAIALALLGPDDFYRPANGHVFAACTDLYRQGTQPDVVTVGNTLRARGVDQITDADLVRLISECPATTRAANYARIVSETKTLRNLIDAATEISKLAFEGQDDVPGALEGARSRLAQVGLPVVSADDVMTVEDFVGLPEDPLSWVIPGLLDRQDRVIVVAPEGSGKSYVLRQIAVAAAYGLHPFLLNRKIPPIRSLIIDLENPQRILQKSLRRILSPAANNGSEEGSAHVWHRPGGINARSRAGAAELDAVCRSAKPDLVCVGPLYKIAPGDSGRREHDLASELANILDDLRIRHGFALVIEHHAPLKQGGHRDLRPFGSLLWSQWPEIGIALNPTDDSGRTLDVEHWRGSRDERPWPSTLSRGQVWPWEATYADGIPADQ